MWLLDKMLRKLVHAGQLIVTDHDGKIFSYGDGSGEPYCIPTASA